METVDRDTLMKCVTCRRKAKKSENRQSDFTKRKGLINNNIN